MTYDRDFIANMADEHFTTPTHVLNFARKCNYPPPDMLWRKFNQQYWRARNERSAIFSEEGKKTEEAIDINAQR